MNDVLTLAILFSWRNVELFGDGDTVSAEESVELISGGSACDDVDGGTGDVYEVR
jgi:hypothetical protein